MYTTQADCEVAAGGITRLVELCDQAGNQAGMDAAAVAVLAVAQSEADAWLNAHMRRMYGPSLPFTSSIPLFLVRLCAHEAIYRLKMYRQATTEEDIRHRAERDAELAAIADGKILPVDGDNYPVGNGGGSPGVFERDPAEAVSRETLKGMW